MLRLLIRRVAWSILILFAIATITFLLTRAVPADPASFLAGQNATAEAVASIRRQYGLDDPLATQYVRYLGDLVVHGDLGVALRTREPVREDIARYFPGTLELLVYSFAVYLALSFVLGGLAAYRQGGRLDGAIRLAAIIGTAVPVFWLGIGLQFVFFYKLGWLPLEGRLDIRSHAPATVTGFYTIDSLLAGDLGLLVNSLRHLMLPVTAVVLSLLAVGTRLTRASVASELREPYVRTARGKGLSEHVVLFKHVSRNALNPILTVTGVQFGYMVSWVIIVEVIFNWQGIGLYAFRSFEVFDYTPIMALTLVATFVFVVVNLVTDLLYPVIDPRIQRG